MFEIIDPSFQVNEQETHLNLVQRIMKKRRIIQSRTTQRNIYLRFLLSTSNSCERLCSVPGFTLGERLRSNIPSNFESQTFLHVETPF